MSLTKKEEGMKYNSVLIIDDEVDIVEGLSEELSQLFTKVDKALNGVQALELVNSNTYDLIISDIQMPNLKGDDLLRKLRMKGVHTPFIFISGNGTRENLLSAIRLGAVEFIEKPFELGAFMKQVEGILELVYKKNKLAKLEVETNDEDLLRNEKKAVGILQVANLIKHKS